MQFYYMHADSEQRTQMNQFEQNELWQIHRVQQHAMITERETIFDICTNILNEIIVQICDNLIDTKQIPTQNSPDIEYPDIDPFTESDYPPEWPIDSITHPDNIKSNTPNFA